jgi:peptide chain release factor 2
VRERADLEAPVGSWKRLTERLSDAKVYAELAVEGTKDAEAEASAAVKEIREKLDQLDLERKLSGEHDAGNAILTLHSGAGGTESQDWAEMLFRMYLRWTERRGYHTEVVDYQPGEGAGSGRDDHR